MALWRPEQKDESPDLTPMIDVVFLLIVFFMVVGKMITDEKIDIQVPVAERSKIPEEAGYRDTITLTKEGTLFKGIRPVSLAQLKEILEVGIQSVKDYKIFLRVDEFTPHREVQAVLKTCSEAGAFNVIFAVYQTPQ